MRLKDVKLRPTFTATAFQFLIGAIKSGKLDKSGQIRAGFNSLLVRLKVYNKEGYRRVYRFQFLIGAIKRFQKIAVRLKIRSFNSLLVRLKEDPAPGWP